MSAIVVGLVFIASWLAFPPKLVARQDEPTTLQTDAEYSYGQLMRFNLKANSPSPIEKATLLIQIPEFSNILSADIEVSPEKQLTVTHVVDLTQLRLAPFTTVTYWWSVENEDGERFESDRQTVEYVDDQFAWHRNEYNGVQINWSGDDQSVGQLAEEAVFDSLARIEQVIPIARPNPLKVFVYPSEADLRAGLRLTGRDWVGAHARPELGVILVAKNGTSTVDSELTRSTAHELAHLYLYTATGDGYDNIPLWLDEGLASMVEGDASRPNYVERLGEAVEDDETIPFSELCFSWPSDEDEALLAYVQSESLVRYIESQYGSQALQRLIAEVAAGADCQGVTLRAIGIPLAELNEEWLKQEMPRSLFQRAWQNGQGWLMLIIAGFLLAGLLARLPKSRNQ